VSTVTASTCSGNACGSRWNWRVVPAGNDAHAIFIQ
jgi:hypothetical protein